MLIVQGLAQTVQLHGRWAFYLWAPKSPTGELYYSALTLRNAPNGGAAALCFPGRVDGCASSPPGRWFKRGLASGSWPGSPPPPAGFPCTELARCLQARSPPPPAQNRLYAEHALQPGAPTVSCGAPLWRSSFFWYIPL